MTDEPDLTELLANAPTSSGKWGGLLWRFRTADEWFFYAA